MNTCIGARGSFGIWIFNWKKNDDTTHERRKWYGRKTTAVEVRRWLSLAGADVNSSFIWSRLLETQEIKKCEREMNQRRLSRRLEASNICSDIVYACQVTGERLSLTKFSLRPENQLNKSVIKLLLSHHHLCWEVSMWARSEYNCTAQQLFASRRFYLTYSNIVHIAPL